MAVRILCDEFGIQSIPLTRENDPQYYIFKGKLYFVWNWDNKFTSLEIESGYALASELQIDPGSVIKKRINAEMQVLKNEEKESM